MIRRIYLKRALDKNRHTYVVFEDQNDRWYIVDGSNLAILKNKLEGELEDIEGDLSLIDRGPGRLIEDGSQEIELIDVTKDNDGYLAKLDNGEKMNLTPDEVKTLIMF